MKAAVFYECGLPQNVQLADVPMPQIGSEDVLIQVKAAALNHLDLWMLGGPAGDGFQFPYWGGSDIAGVVAEVGSGVSSFQPGERVLVNPSLSCGVCAQCIAGEDSLCPDYDILGGGFAEYVAVAANKVMRFPQTLTFVQAAAVPLVFQTAWRALISQARVRPGEEVLVLGASGGVASAAIQIAKLAGARVIVTTSSPEKVERAKALGADEALNRHDGDYWVKIAQWTGRRGLDLVVENVGAATWAQSLNSLAKGGRLVTYGRTSGRVGETNIAQLFWNQLRIIGSTMSNQREFAEVMDLIFQGRLQPVIDMVFPLDQAAAAYARLKSGQQFGKVVIKISDEV
jgi:NADPH:quinone reductase-like Zn-dependent oxidoreductase